MALTFKPEVALLDIGLPEMDGYALGERLRSDLPGELRLIALTGYGQENDHAKTLEAGFEGHLVKPVSLRNLITVFGNAASAPAAS